jgi:hypothetical protein
MTTRLVERSSCVSPSPGKSDASLTDCSLDTAAEEEAERKKAAKKAQKAGSKAKKGKIRYLRMRGEMSTKLCDPS